MNTLMENISESFSLKKWFKNLDMTGVKYQPNIFKTKKYNSISGTIITLISFFIIIYRIIMSIKMILNKTNFKVTTERDTELNENFTVYIQIYKFVYYHQNFLKVKEYLQIIMKILNQQ